MGQLDGLFSITNHFFMLGSYFGMRALLPFLLIMSIDGLYSLFNFQSLNNHGVLIFFLMQFFDLEKRTKEKMEIKRSKCKHKCLKVVKLIGFVGCGVDLEIARYILSHTLSLEKIIINPHHPFIVTTEDTDEHLKARSRARQHLEHILPPGTQLVVL